MNPAIKLIVVCRQASDPLLPGYQVGYFCEVCRKELQISPFGLARLQDGGRPFCNTHGFALAKLYEDQDMLGGVVLTPDAAQALDKLVERMREKHAKG